MPQAMVTIGGRSYRLACNPGEEPHLEQLGKFVDGKIDEMRSSFGEIGDQRIVVMAALSIADELFEARRKSEKQAAEAAEALDAEKQAHAGAEARAAALVASIEEVTGRVESLTESLNTPTED
jgi:cell division protein ZapA